MEGKAKRELMVPGYANPSMGSVNAPEKESYQENLYLETKLRIRSSLFVFQWPEFMSVLHCPEGLCFCTLGSD